MIVIIDCEIIRQQAENNINNATNYHLVKDAIPMVHFQYEIIILFFISSSFSFRR